ncbi:hypothetical protein [Neorhizobium petrolearium]|uniref:Uncharacterized protein n=1 Tax=Neorhizobium petrolearium TaxID=515361 RepID=A0ABY8LZM4_9HYPH|nr:hypothetical protein [Neorhizobium petrolearium]MCC2612648.1 hypothetical protein [Neorhizobium petrolearium]WGI67771.1 hypothetical protein QEO92_22745 [Neorhizobium petrolearium]
MAAAQPTILTPTGRGSYVDPRKVSLDDILFSYDRCPPEFIDEPRDAVIAAYREAEQQIRNMPTT